MKRRRCGSAALGDGICAGRMVAVHFQWLANTTVIRIHFDNLRATWTEKGK